MVVNGVEPVPGAVCSTRRSRISDQQRAPRAAQQCRRIPNQHGCAWERAVFARSMLPANLFFEIKKYKTYLSLFEYIFHTFQNICVRRHIFLYICVGIRTYTRKYIRVRIHVYM